MAQLNTRIILRNDSSINWKAAEDQILLKGEVGVEFLEDGTAKIKIGDGQKTWAELPYFGGEERETQVYELTVNAGADHLAAIATLTEGKEVVAGDIAIIKENIADEKVSHTAYIYNGTAWKAMDGNYNANNVYFDNDLVLTYAFGRYAPDSSGRVTVPAEGSSLKALLEDAYSLETKTGLKTADPTASIGGSIQYYEIGSTGTQDVTVSLNADGEYKYGYSIDPAEGTEGATAADVKNDKTTGVVVDTSVEAPYKVVFNGEEVSPKATKGATFTLAPAAQLAKAEMTATGTVYHTKGGIPVSNLGKLYPGQRIAAGSKSTSAATRARWYIPMFQGFTYAADAIADPANITEEQIKALNAPSASTHGAIKKVINDKAFGSSLNNKPTKITTATASRAWRQYFLVVPKDYGWTMSGAKDGNNIDCTVRQAADVTMTFGTGDNTVDVVYNVYYIHNAADYGTLKITWN